jgi:2,3-bisphosphoglycerate-dependent phosphoglycerate mutase
VSTLSRPAGATVTPDGQTALSGQPTSVMVVSDRPVPVDATRLVLVRHGEAACNVDGVVGGKRGCRGLTAAGRRQAERLRDRLVRTAEVEPAAVYSSVLARAIETAEILLPAFCGAPRRRTLRVEARCDLCELHPGDADGLGWEEFTARFGEPGWDDDPSRPVAPGGESWAGFVARASTALEELVARHRGGTVLVVTHAGVIESSMLRFLPFEGAVARLGLRTRHASLTTWERHEGRWLLLRYNDAAHLEGEDAASRVASASR